MVYASAVREWSAFEAQILDPAFNAATMPLAISPPETTDQDTDASLGLSLFFVHELEAQNRRGGGGDELTHQATRAMYFARLGDIEMAKNEVRDLLRKSSHHPLGNYAFAVIHLSQSQAAQREAQRFDVMRQDADLQHESHWEHLAADADAKASLSSREALLHFVRALAHWPSTTVGKNKYWDDHQRRDRALIQVLALAFPCCHDFAAGEMSQLQSLSARKAGKPIAFFFDAELDAGVLAVLRECEASRYMSAPVAALVWKTWMLQIYFALSPTDYQRFLPVWVDQFRTASSSEAAHWLEPSNGWRVEAQLARWHLLSAVGQDGAVELVRTLERAATVRAQAFHDRACAFIINGPPESDDFDD